MLSWLSFVATENDKVVMRVITRITRFNLLNVAQAYGQINYKTHLFPQIIAAFIVIYLKKKTTNSVLAYTALVRLRKSLEKTHVHPADFIAK